MCLTIIRTRNTTYHKCVGDTFAVNCTVHGTKLVWSSEKYIGTNGRHIEYGLFNKNGSIIHSPMYNSTRAELLIAGSVNNILKSTLTITVSRNGTIICRDDLRYIQLNISVIAGK